MSRFTDEQIARVTHQANKAYCEALGDHSQQDWETAPQWQRDSAIAGVAAVRANPEIGPAEQHQCWWDHKIVEGWVYGPEKDPIAKTHPCCVPYLELPETQRAKDSIFGNIARTMLRVA